MSIWNEVRGQDAAVELLRRSVARGRLAHGYAFHGPKGSGRRLVARSLAQSLFCDRIADDELDACGECPSCRQFEAGAHPDLLEVRKPDGKRSIPLELLVGEPEKRGREGLCYELSMRPLAGPRRIAIIDDADTLAVEGANALLKTLEEPPAGAILILIAESPESLLPTIRSRCQPLHFAPLPDETLADLLVEAGHDRRDAEAVAPLAGGGLVAAAQLLDPELRTLRQTARAAVSATPYNAIATAETVRKAVESIGIDSAAQREAAQTLFRFVVDLLRDALRIGSGGDGPEDASRLLASIDGDEEVRLETLGRMIDRVLLAETSVAMMMPLPLCLDALFDDLGAIRRGADRETVTVPVWG